jgi:hypothetical protein
MQKVEHEARFKIQSVIVKCYWKHEQQSGKLKQQSAILKQQSGKHETQTSKWEASTGSCKIRTKQQTQTTKCKHQNESKENNPNDKFTKKIIKVRWRRTPKHK